MAARDDSVIRGSLIACLIFLVLSLALNFLFWRWGDLAAADNAAAEERLASVQNELRTKEEQAILMKAMLGVGTMTEAQFESLSQSSSGDEDMEVIEKNFLRDMALLGPTVEPQERNYPNLPNYLVNAIRSLNDNYGQARDEATLIRTQADSDVNNARLAQAQAEKNRDDETKKLETERSQFTEDRDRMKVDTEAMRDNLNKSVQDMQAYRQQKSNEIASLNRRSSQLLDTVTEQKKELTTLRSDRFENVQGLISYVFLDGKVVQINLGSGDALRPGVTFGVIDADETRLKDARIKASIQVTKILGEHLAEARVVAVPEIQYPIIPGDKIYSPFWAPGRTVKIALAGDIDIDGDNRPDTDALVGMIQAAGATVAAIIDNDGEVEGTFDSSIRFLVIGESPTVTQSADVGRDAKAQAILKSMGEVKEQAIEKGITVIPAYKLQDYLRTIDDSLTTPLGSAAREKDFGVEQSKSMKSILPTDLPEIYRDQKDRVQRNQDIVPPN